MSRPRFIDIDGRRYLWSDILELRRQQLAACQKAEQPALFELALDCRPVTQRSAAGARWSRKSSFAAPGCSTSVGLARGGPKT